MHHKLHPVKLVHIRNILRVLLADDDSDDRYFFNKALLTVPRETELVMVNDGSELMRHLKHPKNLPDVLFLDHNMPGKNGVECLQEIKRDSHLKKLPVVMYSTYLDEPQIDKFYENGAHYAMRKTDLAEFKVTLHEVLTHLIENKFVRPPIDHFAMGSKSVF